MYRENIKKCKRILKQAIDKLNYASNNHIKLSDKLKRLLKDIKQCESHHPDNKDRLARLTVKRDELVKSIASLDDDINTFKADVTAAKMALKEAVKQPVNCKKHKHSVSNSSKSTSNKSSNRKSVLQESDSCSYDSDSGESDSTESDSSESDSSERDSVESRSHSSSTSQSSYTSSSSSSSSSSYRSKKNVKRGNKIKPQCHKYSKRNNNKQFDLAEFINTLLQPDTCNNSLNFDTFKHMLKKKRSNPKHISFLVKIFSICRSTTDVNAIDKLKKILRLVSDQFGLI